MCSRKCQGVLNRLSGPHSAFFSRVKICLRPPHGFRFMAVSLNLGRDLGLFVVSLFNSRLVLVESQVRRN
jgi:hypothetical protein